MTSGHRDRLLLRFRDLATNERGLLSNARCLGEGVDVPSIDGVAFIDPRRSTIDIVQAVGRAIRKSADKKVGTIVLPVFLSKSDDADQVLDESAFKHVWDVLKALRAHDESLGEELDDLRRRLGARRAPPQRPGKIKLDVPVGWVGAPFVHAFNARLVEQTTASWEFYFGLLEGFVQREGHARVPAHYHEDRYGLGAWVGRQRAKYGERALMPELEARLEALPGWTWDPFAKDWDEGFSRLRRFVQREGHARVRSGWREDGYRLGQWAIVQRSKYGQGALDFQRRARLEALPGWTWNLLQADWEEGFSHLLRFVEREGHARVDAQRREAGYRLGQWVTVQRTRYREGTLDPEREALLGAVPEWTWDARAAGWEEGLAQLQRFVEREGHARVPALHREGEYRLGQWVRVQRTSFRKGELDSARRKRLERLPGWTWDLRAAAWDDRFASLHRYVEREGHAHVPDNWCEDGFELGHWVRNQVASHRRGTLNRERGRRLESLPGWTWDRRQTHWEEGFAQLQRFVEREGHARVPQEWQENGFRLGRWVSNLRTSFRNDRLERVKREQLEAVRGWTWNAGDSRVGRVQ
jgi:hypothetical protein